MYEPMCTRPEGGWRAASGGEWSDALVVTNVANRALPLLRCAVEDRVVVDPDPDVTIELVDRPDVLPRTPAGERRPVVRAD